MLVRGYFTAFVLVYTGIFTVTFSQASKYAPSPPMRQATVIETYTAYEWWLLAWADNSSACRVLTDKEGLPELAEVKSDCSATVYKLWLDQPLCSAATYGGDLTACQGYYLRYIGSHQAEREVVVELPPASASLTLEGCTQSNYETVCALMPKLQIIGLEPLPDYVIGQIHYEIIDSPRLNTGGEQVCQGAVCEVPLSLTSLAGEGISFWADSTYGDSSEHYEVMYRIKPNGDGRWQVDVLSSQMADGRRQAMSLEWEAFPPLGENPRWLSYPADAGALASSQPYQYLGGQLIQSWEAQASACTDGGLLASGYASQCGLEAVMDRVIEWQNQFDQTIYDVANRYDLSPQLLKNVIAQESQFWPGWYEVSPLEYGLARLTETGADTLFRWNEGFYTEFCSQILWNEVCASGYDNLAKVYQEMLRGALAGKINVYCETCEYGFDASRVDYGIEALAQSLLANAAQVEQLYVNLTGKKAGASSSYEDLWRFTLVDYNAGPGCLGAALKATVKGNAELNWQNVSANLVGGCRDAIGYVENIAK